MKIGVLCPSEIAIRRFMPSLMKMEGVEFAGVGVNSVNERYGDELPSKTEIEEMLLSEAGKAKVFVDTYGGRQYDSYEAIVADQTIEAIYIPLPPALHHKWAKKALINGKHVLVEKPSTISYSDTQDLVQMAETKHLALHENYMFIYHDQLDALEALIRSGEIGEVRLYRMSFGFPRRAASDFRYNRKLGGGALIDAGGYTMRLATRFLGESIKIDCAQSNYLPEFDVDIYGSATLSNEKGEIAQVSFGMDNDYRCELEVWGSKGSIRTGRIFTAPAGFVPSVTIKKNTETEERELPADDAFKKSIEYFVKAIQDSKVRKDDYRAILKQAELVDLFSSKAGT